jgi:hypothetical protein
MVRGLYQIGTMDTELERFKTDIDIRQFAESLGFVLNRRESSRRSSVMVRGDGQDKIVIRRESGGTWVYFSVKCAHSGTIIDLARQYGSENLGYVRKRLRQWSSDYTPTPALRSVPQLEPTTRDYGAVARDWHAAEAYISNIWLEQERCVPPALIHSPRFAGCLRIDGRGNVLCGHVGIAGSLSGFDRKNRGFTGFSGGGEKGLACSNDFDGDDRMVIAEGFIDMLSHAALFPDDRTRYRAFSGGLNDKQPELIRAHILALPRGSVVVAATDGDDAGKGFADVIEGLCEGYEFQAHRPSSGDWNDVLRENSFPTALQANAP